MTEALQTLGGMSRAARAGIAWLVQRLLPTMLVALGLPALAAAPVHVLTQPGE